MKVKVEVLFRELKGRELGVNERVRAREGVGLLVKEELERYVKEWKKVSSKLMWVRMTLGLYFFLFIFFNFRKKSVDKDIKTIQKEMREVIRQITASVTFLPLLDTLCKF